MGTIRRLAQNKYTVAQGDGCLTNDGTHLPASVFQQKQMYAN